MRPRLTALLLLACALLAVATAPARPNVLLILADDLGASPVPTSSPARTKPASASPSTSPDIAALTRASATRGYPASSRSRS